MSAAPKFKIGLVFDLAGTGDNSFNDSAYNGLVALAKAYKGWIDGRPEQGQLRRGGPDQVPRAQGGRPGPRDPDAGPRRGRLQAHLRHRVPVRRRPRQGGQGLPRHPLRHHRRLRPRPDGSSNITCLGFKENEGSFLVGAIAALMAKGKKIGFLGGMDIPLIHRFENGFDAGAMYVNPAYREHGHDPRASTSARTSRPSMIPPAATTSPPTSTSRAPRSSSTRRAARVTACSRRRRKTKKLCHRRRLRPGPHLRLGDGGGHQGPRPSSSSPR